MRKVFVDWDTDGIDLEDVGLTDEVMIPNDIEEDEVADYLSDEYDFCVNSWCYIDE